MLWTVFVLLLVFWLFAAVSGVGGWAHLILGLAAVILLSILLANRRAAL